MSDDRGLERFDAYAGEQRRYWSTVRQGFGFSLKDERAMLWQEIAWLSDSDET